jgi:Mg/Co/Ni transporter MgtE
MPDEPHIEKHLLRSEIARHVFIGMPGRLTDLSAFPAGLAEIVGEPDESIQTHILRLAARQDLESEPFSDGLEEGDPSDHLALIDAFNRLMVVDLLDQISPTQVAEALAALPADQADDYLLQLDPETAPKILQLIKKHHEQSLL